MQLICATCDAAIPSQNINIGTDLAKCQACGEIHKASQLLTKKEKETAQALYPPYGSKIDIYELENGDIEISLPPKGLSGGTSFLAVFSVFWLSFVAVWTFFAAMGSIFFALFSIPFWLVGLGMGYSVVNAIFEKQFIRLARSHLHIHKKRPLNPKKLRIAYREIDKMEFQEVDVKDAFTSWDKVSSQQLSTDYSENEKPKATKVPTVVSGLKRYPFFEHISKEEGHWLMYTLRDLMQERRNKRRPDPEQSFMEDFDVEGRRQQDESDDEESNGLKY